MLVEVRAGEIEKPEHVGAERATETMRATMDFMVTNSGLLIVGLLCIEIVFGVVVLFVGDSPRGGDHSQLAQLGVRLLLHRGSEHVCAGV